MHHEEADAHQCINKINIKYTAKNAENIKFVMHERVYDISSLLFSHISPPSFVHTPIT